LNGATQSQISALNAMNLPALQARYAEVIGETTRCTNRVFLVRRITERLAETEAAETAGPTAPEAPPAPAGEPGHGEAPAEASDEKPLTKLTVEELRAKYVEVVGRPTGSVDRGYLIWKIREAKKGRIPVGPSRRGPSPAADVEHMVLPLRLPTPVVNALDVAWKQLGLRSRMDLMRRSLHDYLATNGQTGGAELLAPLVGANGDGPAEEAHDGP